MDEDSGFMNQRFYNRGKVGLHLNPARNGHLENQRGKPEQPSKLLDENITTGKNTESNTRTFSQFPGKPSGLDTESSAKKPLGISELPGIFSEGMTSGDFNVWTEATGEGSKPNFPESHNIIPGPSGKAFPQSWTSMISGQGDVTKLVGTDHSHQWTIKTRHGQLVQGSDGKTYRLLRGPPGLMGPLGEDVSPSFVFP